MVRKFYRSNQFMLTMKQIEWLEKQPNKSYVIRLLLEIAMSNKEFEQKYAWFELQEQQIATLKHHIKNKQYRTVIDLAKAKHKLEELEENRKRDLMKLLCVQKPKQ